MAVPARSYAPRREHGVQDEVAASNMITTVKRRFQAAFRSVVAQHVSGARDIDEEISDITKILSRPGAGT